MEGRAIRRERRGSKNRTYKGGDHKAVRRGGGVTVLGERRGRKCL